MKGQPTRTITLPRPLQPGQRRTEIVNQDVGANQQLAVVVSTNTGTLIVERPMYFPFHSTIPAVAMLLGMQQGIK
jgi:hypothetical protein